MRAPLVCRRARKNSMRLKRRVKRGVERVVIEPVLVVLNGVLQFDSFSADERFDGGEAGPERVATGELVENFGADLVQSCILGLGAGILLLQGGELRGERGIGGRFGIGRAGGGVIRRLGLGQGPLLGGELALQRGGLSRLWRSLAGRIAALPWLLL